MKNYIMFAMLIMVLSLSSCSDIDIPESRLESAISQTKLTRASESCILSFENGEEFENAVKKIATLTSDEEKMEWVNKNFQNFKSIQNIYWDAMEEMAGIENVNIEEYNKFEQKYKCLYFPKYEEDAGFYIPMSDLDAAFLVNEDCEVTVSNEIVNLKDIFNYDSLIELGRAYYAKETVLPFGTMTPFYLNSTSMNSVGPEYDSGWKEYGNRKVKLKARRRFEAYSPTPVINGSKSLLHLEFCFRKHTWLGWANYKCKSTITFKADIPGGRTVGPITFSHNSTSSHDSEVAYPIHISSDASHWYYTFVEAPCEATINYNDITEILKYNWNMPGIQCTTPISASHVYITPTY